MERNRKKIRIEYYLIMFLVLFMPFHYWICELMLSGTSIDNLTRDIVIIILAVLVFKRKIPINKYSRILYINILALISISVISYFALGMSSTFNSMRTYLMPMLFGLICSRIRIDEKDFIKLHRALFIELAVIGIFGFVQAFFIGSQFLINLGYKSSNGMLSASAFYINGFFGKQRSVGTFESPNECGLLLAFAICIGLYGKEYVRTKRYTLWMVCLIIGLLATLSRSSILGLAIAVVTMYVSNNRKKIKGSKLIRIVPITIAALIIVYIVDNKYLNGLFQKMITSALRNAVMINDLSAQKHMSDLRDPLNVIFNNPFGRGLGRNGPMVLGQISDALNVESGIYLMMYEEGIIFGLLYFVPFIFTIINTLKKRTKYIVSGAVCIVSLIQCIFLPATQAYASMFYTFMFIGFSFNKEYKGKSVLRNMSSNEFTYGIRA